MKLAAVLLSLAAFLAAAPSQSLEQLRRHAEAATPPTEPGTFQKPDLVDLEAIARARNAPLHFDIRYATANNFLGVALYPEARAFLQRPAAQALLAAAIELKSSGYGLLIFDAYRPWFVTRLFWDATPPRLRNFVANPAKGSKHNRGCAVDLTLYDLRTGLPADMPSAYDEMTPRASPRYTGGTAEARARRDLLRRILERHNFTVDRGEWWHYDFASWHSYPVLNLRFALVSPVI